MALRLAAAVLTSCLGGHGPAVAQSMPEAENGRYALSPVADGVIRLDTRTGAVSNCANSGSGWTCYAVPDERAALDAEIGRLQSDNEKLKAQLAASESGAAGQIEQPKFDKPVPKSDLPPKSDSLNKAEPNRAESERKIEIPLPSDRDMDRMMSFLDQAWRRLVEMANRMQKDVSGKI